MNKLTYSCRLIILEIRKHNLETLYNDRQDWTDRKRINKLLYFVNRKISILSKLKDNGYTQPQTTIRKLSNNY